MTTYELRPAARQQRRRDEPLWPWLLLTFLLMFALGLAVSLLAGWVSIDLR